MPDFYLQMSIKFLFLWKENKGLLQQIELVDQIIFVGASKRQSHIVEINFQRSQVDIGDQLSLHNITAMNLNEMPHRKPLPEFGKGYLNGVFFFCGVYGAVIAIRMNPPDFTEINFVKHVATFHKETVGHIHRT